MEDIITERLIALDLPLADKAAAISAIAGLLAASGRISDTAAYIRDVNAREELVETGIGGGIAIPHARSQSVVTPSLVFLRLQSPIPWGEAGDANLIFGIAVPASNVDDSHLRILSSVAKKLLDDETRRVIEDSGSKQAILDSLML